MVPNYCCLHLMLYSHCSVSGEVTSSWLGPPGSGRVGVMSEESQVRMDDMNDQNRLRRSPKDGRKSLFIAIPGWKQAIVSSDKSYVRR